MDLICATKLSNTGELTGSPSILARLCRCSESDIEAAVAELTSTNAAHIAKQNGSITVTCRRLKREHDISVKRSLAGRIGGKSGSKSEAKTQAKAKQSVVSVSASSTLDSREGDSKGGTPKPTAKQRRDAEFAALWSLYPKKVGKVKARDHYEHHKPDFEKVKAGIARYIDHVEKQRITGFADLNYADGSTWFHQARWEDECSTAIPGSSRSGEKKAKQAALLDAWKDKVRSAAPADRWNVICGAPTALLADVEDWAKAELGFVRSGGTDER